MRKDVNLCAQCEKKTLAVFFCYCRVWKEKREKEKRRHVIKTVWAELQSRLTDGQIVVLLGIRLFVWYEIVLLYVYTLYSMLPSMSTSGGNEPW